jgi:hypothetical protein
LTSGKKILSLPDGGRRGNSAFGETESLLEETGFDASKKEKGFHFVLAR